MREMEGQREEGGGSRGVVRKRKREEKMLMMPEGSLGRTAQDVHLDFHTAPELCVGRRSRKREWIETERWRERERDRGGNRRERWEEKEKKGGGGKRENTNTNILLS